MLLNDLIAPKGVISSLRARTPKQVLLDMSELAARVSGVPAREIFDAVLQRERLGPTGVGAGIAIPHGKLLNLKEIFAVFARLERPIDFGANDGAPVDIVCMLIAPESAGADHLRALARIARVLREPDFVARLRRAKDASSLYLLLTQNADSRAA